MTQKACDMFVTSDLRKTMISNLCLRQKFSDKNKSSFYLKLKN